MSSIGGKKKEVKSFESFSKYIGLFKGNVVAINPDRQKLNKLLGREDSENDKEIEYTGEKEGVEFCRITFWLEVEGKEGLYIPHSISLRNEVRRSKTGKIQLINCIGETTWVEVDEDDNFDENSLWEKFRNFVVTTGYKTKSGEIVSKWEEGATYINDIVGPKAYRPALIGEEELANFMRVWLSKLDMKDVDANILLDTPKLFRGNVKDLSSQIDGDFDTPFVALAYVRADEQDATKQYQKVFKHFLPLNFMKFIKDGFKFPNNFTRDVWNKFVAEVKGEYGVDGEYVLEPLREYDPSEDIATSTKTKADVVTPTSSKY